MDEDNKLILQNKTDELVNQILAEDDVNKVKDLTHLFNVACVKKDIIRVKTLDNLYDTVISKVAERFEKRPDEFSNSDLISYLQVTQNALDKAKKSASSVDETPAIVQQQNNQVNINIGDSEKLTRESRDKVIDAIDAFLKRVKNESANANVESIENKNNNDLVDDQTSSLLNSED
jgi:hypothetical protein